MRDFCLKMRVLVGAFRTKCSSVQGLSIFLPEHWNVPRMFHFYVPLYLGIFAFIWAYLRLFAYVSTRRSPTPGGTYVRTYLNIPERTQICRNRPKSLAVCSFQRSKERSGSPAAEPGFVPLCCLTAEPAPTNDARQMSMAAAPD